MVLKKVFKRGLAAVLAASIMISGNIANVNSYAAGNEDTIVQGARINSAIDKAKKLIEALINSAKVYYDLIKDYPKYKELAEKILSTIDEAKKLIESGEVSELVLSKIINTLNGLIDKAKEAGKEVKEEIEKKADEVKKAAEKKIEEAEKAAEEEVQRAKDDWEKAKKEAFKYSSEWVNGSWYDADGSQTYTATGSWKQDSKGWWFEDTNGWYPKDQWQRIDKKWYYFTSDGYMDYSEYRDGYWLGADGAWIEVYKDGRWQLDSTGWWYTDNTTWYPRMQWLWIDGVCYYFNNDGYIQ